MTKDEALKLARRALWFAHDDGYSNELSQEALAAIREALAQPEIPMQNNNPGLEWDKIPKSFNDWWDSDYDPTGNPFSHETPAYWAWAGWKAAQMAQPEQEPVAWMYQDKSTHEVRFQKHMRDFVDHSKTSEVPLYSEPLANHELQCVCGAVWCGDEMVHLPNKTTPLHRKPLTDEEIYKIANDLFYGNGPCDTLAMCRAIEAAHGIWPENSDCHGPDWTDRDGEYLK